MHRATAPRAAGVIIAAALPLILWAVCRIGPTFDDYTTLQSPNLTPDFAAGLLPNDSFWRPWDFLFGCLLGWQTGLFPWLNHLVIIAGHTVSTWLIARICRHLGIGPLATAAAMLLFFFSPAGLGATLACDGLNQTFAQMWGLVALLIYIKMCGDNRTTQADDTSSMQTDDRPVRRGILCYLIFVGIAALSKENGLAWAIVPPAIAWAFHRVTRATALRHVAAGLIFAAVYFVLRITLRHGGTEGADYLATTLTGHLTDFLQMVLYNWLPMDYVVTADRSLLTVCLAAVTAVASLPLLALLFWPRKAVITQRPALVIVACWLVLASPHLLTLASIMHNYAPLAMTALLAAYLCDSIRHYRLLLVCLALYIGAAVITDAHHAVWALRSGELSRQLAQQAIVKTGEPVDSVLCITIEDERPRYSSFIVRPQDAFAWGLSVRHYTGYRWPQHYDFKILSATDNDATREQVQAQADAIARSAVGQHAADGLTFCVWIFDGDEIRVVRPPKL